MRNTLDVSILAQKWYRENHEKHAVSHGDNVLFRMLYKAYCRRSGERDQWGEFSGEYDFRDACSRIYGWYKRTYEIVYQMPTGQQGQKRGVDKKEAAYSFSLCYSDDRSFKRYLVDGKHVSGTLDLYSFILHTAVAFLVPPDELDSVLQDLGFHPLHVKNVHHLAIYYVLLTFAAPDGSLRGNPFEQVRKLYDRAREILDEPSSEPVAAYSFGGKFSWQIRNDLFLKRAIGTENFENLVRLNKDALNMRHSLLLRDFRTLTTVFLNIFDDAHYRPDGPLDARSDEKSYSFYAFAGRFCRKPRSQDRKLREKQTVKIMPRDKFRELLGSMITVSQKYPTREVMILLWMFAHCFAYTPGIYMDPDDFDRLNKKLLKADGRSLSDPFYRRYYDGNILDIYGLITNSDKDRQMQEFRGDDLIDCINEKLYRYGWKPLNSKLSSDYYIQRLKELELVLDRDDSYSRCISIAHDNSRITGIPASVPNVPCPLVAITWILYHIQAVHRYQPEAWPFPLEFSFYEQI